MSRLDTLVQENSVNRRSPLVLAIIGGLVGFAVWSFFAYLEEVSVAMGEVVPQGKIKVIQHLEGGIITDIHVQQGDVVRKGAELVQLDLGTGGVNKEELEVRLDGLLLNRARLEAEATDGDLNLPEEIVEARPGMAVATERSYQARLRDLNSRLKVLKDKMRQRELAVEELEKKMDNTRRNLNLSKRRFNMSSDLLNDKLTSKMDHLKLESEVQKLEGELRTLKTSIPKAKASVAEEMSKIDEEKTAFQREALEELGTVEQSIAQTLELLSKATDQGIRALIKSPIDGVVKNMTYNTIGNVVSAGEPIMEIVPIGENLVIEARLNPIDRGYVEENQDAVVKINTYDFVRYGSLEGKVIHVAPDSTTSQEGETYFRVIVQTEKTYLGDKEGTYEITPGMEATVDIHTGEKSVIEYLIKPVLKMKHEAFRER
ncbi:HlyD family type I secretion periplasmic adaptor subunit [Terasakiella sp. A23]|uniref:HlyD family type I secretion periplasmic adaptor subunit n=1 Tax=Terasakiella sp. FCG-A23 TaxID=3080561 RepID=UPI0029556350|nr:HlyD family type I secretion periplasmic adaptor subunit [Terasakiella sp. A23]MDV7338741.1 HlyD family type I secretion periplasmic adaptor subunit [Terasakiella sp. A23]